MKLEVFNSKGLIIKKIDLNNSIWGIKPHKQAIFDTVISQQSSMRQGTHKTKTRSEVSGGGKKPWKQKGTGRARQGSIRAPQWKGGGVVFGPTTKKNYLKYVNKKVKKLAIKSVFSLKIKEKKIIIINKFEIEKISTKSMIEILYNLKINKEKLLIITTENDKIGLKSSRNINKINVIKSNNINIFDLLNTNKILLLEKTIKIIEETYL